MRKEELRSTIEKIRIDPTLIETVEGKYGTLPEDVKKILSYKINDLFIGDWRVISGEELLNPVAEIQVDFAAEGLVPVFDTMDNDYICYDCENKNWTLYNIVDNIRFSPQKELIDYLENNYGS